MTCSEARATFMVLMTTAGAAGREKEEPPRGVNSQTVSVEVGNSILFASDNILYPFVLSFVLKVICQTFSTQGS